MAKDTRIDIGFDGGAATSAELAPERVAELRSAVEGGAAAGTWFALMASDGGEVVVDLAKVVYLRIAPTSRTAGFGA